MIKHRCWDCGVAEGQLHQEGCDWEICPICKRQLLSCPKHNWDNLKDKEREPFLFKYHRICSRCGKLSFDLFMVSDNEWKEVIGTTYETSDVLCKECFNEIKILRESLKGRIR